MAVTTLEKLFVSVQTYTPPRKNIVVDCDNK